MRCQVVVKQTKVGQYQQKNKHRKEERSSVINEECRNHSGPEKGNSNDPKQEELGSCQRMSKELMQDETRDGGDQTVGNKQVHDE